MAYLMVYPTQVWQASWENMEQNDDDDDDDDGDDYDVDDDAVDDNGNFWTKPDEEWIWEGGCNFESELFWYWHWWPLWSQKSGGHASRWPSWSFSLASVAIHTALQEPLPGACCQAQTSGAQGPCKSFVKFGASTAQDP